MHIVRPYKSKKNPHFIVIPVHQVRAWEVVRLFLLIMLPVVALAGGAVALDIRRTISIEEGKKMDARIDAMLDEPFRPIITVFNDNLNLYPMDCPSYESYAPPAE